MIEVFVSRLGIDSASSEYVVVLQEKNGERVLPIWIAKPEAESIVLHMHKVKRPRPITHDLVRSIITQLGATLVRANILRIESRTYIAELHLEADGSRTIVDARPSDSIAIALRLDAPIYVAEQLLVDAAPEADSDSSDDSDPEYEVGAFEAANDDSPTAPDLSAEQLKRYLEALRPEDFGKFKP